MSLARQFLNNYRTSLIEKPFFTRSITSAFILSCADLTAQVLTRNTAESFERKSQVFLFFRKIIVDFQFKQTSKKNQIILIFFFNICSSSFFLTSSRYAPNSPILFFGRDGDHREPLHLAHQAHAAPHRGNLQVLPEGLQHPEPDRHHPGPDLLPRLNLFLLPLVRFVFRGTAPIFFFRLKIFFSVDLTRSTSTSNGPTKMWEVNSRKRANPQTSTWRLWTRTTTSGRCTTSSTSSMWPPCSASSPSTSAPLPGTFTCLILIRLNKSRL